MTGLTGEGSERVVRFKMFTESLIDQALNRELVIKKMLTRKKRFFFGALLC